ncbi:MAG: hypothetical protein ACYC8T_33255 [Myxococcaceae bacterium]
MSTQARAGVGRTDLEALSPVGYDPVYGAWDAQAAAGAATLRFAVASGTLEHPVIVLHGYTGGAPHLTRGGQPLIADAHYFASVDVATSTLWLTLNQGLTGTAVLTIDP